MNCQDIARILDEQEVNSLLGGEQSDVHAHLATCLDCARDWRIHAYLSATEIPAVPAELRAIYAAPMAGVADAGTRRRSRFIVIGALAVVAAAAAMLALQVNQYPAPAAAIADPVRIAPSSMPDSDATLSSVGSEARAENPAQTAKKAEQDPAIATAKQAELRILLMPTRYDSKDNAAKPAIDAFHSSLLQAMRSIPEVVVEIGSPGSVSDQPANRVTVVSPRATTLSSGARIYHSADGSRTWQEFATFRGPPQWAVEVILESGKIPGQSSAVDQFIDGAGIPTGMSCDYQLAASGERPAISSGPPAMCTSVEGLAAWLVAALRPQPAPPLAGTAQLVSSLSDVSTYDRPGAFHELLNRARQGGDVLDAAAIDAINAYIRGLTSEQRVSSMISLRGVRQPGLVVPLLESLQRDDDEKVRLEALATLAKDYPDDSRLRAALETVARQDTSQLVRMVAQRALYGDAQWQPYVVATLADKSLPVAERLAPARYEAGFANFPEGFDKMKSYLGSEQVTRQLVDIFQELRSEMRQSGAEIPPGLPPGLAARLAELGAPASAAQLAPGPAAPAGSAQAPRGFGAVRSPQRDAAELGVVGLLTITNPSAATDLRIRILTENPDRFSPLTGNAFSALMEKRDDPRVGKVLDDIAAGKSGPELKDMLERMVATRPQENPPKSR